MTGSQAVVDIQNEIDLYKSHLGEFGYQFLLLKGFKKSITMG